MSVLFLAFASEVVRDICVEIVMKHPGSAGYRVSLLYKKASVFSFFLGGSVFSSDWLLTITLWGQGHFMSSYTVFICPPWFPTYVRPDPYTSRSSIGLPP